MQQKAESGTYAEVVANQAQWAYHIGLSDVPIDVINGRCAIVGAQPYEVFKNARTQILSQKKE